MKRADLEHILRACRSVTGETEFVVIGSQAILGRFPDAPRVLRQSMEARGDKDNGLGVHRSRWRQALASARPLLNCTRTFAAWGDSMASKICVVGTGRST
jgi:hypothetical protein